MKFHFVRGVAAGSLLLSSVIVTGSVAQVNVLTQPILDWFTPANHEQLDKEDADLNSSGATLLPGNKRVIGGGKQGVLYSLDTANLGHRPMQ